MSDPTKALFRIHVAVLVSYLAGTVLLWPRVPDRIPAHFGFSGAADRWSDAGLIWFLLPLVAVFTAAVVRGAMWLAEQSPDLWNLPEKQRFRELPEPDRASIIQAMERFLHAVSIFVTLVFAALQVGIYVTATGRTEGLPPYVTVFVFGGLAAVLIAALAVNRRMAARIRATHKARVQR